MPLEWNSGANGYVYFVCNNPGGVLAQLPHVTPAQVKAARRIKKMLTGRLTSQVGTCQRCDAHQSHAFGSFLVC